ncbi:D-2-hydroxyacid dehydrogenase [Marinobacter panjinensis]|uniref:D-2-hydroxyacid dehydrogenase n=1 Tax=Marinobacter panjinensis TaxID=2576384 RepID=A0A4U6QVH2_9GAMM|nr:D-2-hydroxyacid dehydrogenase [Marinobacter panjinensis]MCR8914971.1 D-2-hydroxyacid dehydrogenase [Marinobacter panjinensis]TKV64212.1 D-2-hydroxyacid dehydrogenase [Marinobacter panjinensis]
MTQHSKPVVTVLTAPGEKEPPGMDALRARAEVRFASDEPTLRDTLPGTDVMMVTDFRTEALAAAWPSADKLKWIHATSAGVDALMFPDLIKGDVVVTNARGIFDRTIAEYVLCTILMFAKDFPRSLKLQSEHKWQHRDTERAEGKQVLIVGAGSIGGQIARLCKAAGLKPHGVARKPRHDDPDFIAVHGNDDLTEQLGLADFVVIAAPLTPQTEGLFDEKAFKSMRTSARLINIGRGPVVKTDDLITALNNGDIAGAALDVFEEEPLPADHPLWDMENVIMTAHMSGDFIGWKRALTDQFLENLDRWHKGQDLFNFVDKKLGYASK